MSQQDRALLAAAGLSVAEAAKLFERSRAALYQGLSGQRHYFSVRDAIIILQDAKRRDSKRIDELIEFISKTYGEAGEAAALLPGRVTLDQINHALPGFDEVKLIFNGATEHLSGDSAFSIILRELTINRQRLGVTIVAAEWAIQYFRKKIEADGKPSGLSFVIHDDAIFSPCFLLMRGQDLVRGFIFLKLSIEEMYASEALALWKHFPSKPGFTESAERTSRERPAVGRRRGTSRSR
jgi:hypothetical protein